MPGAICGYDGAILYYDIVNALSESEASEKICFIDACHVGTMAKNATDNSWTKNVKSEKDQAFLVYCRSDEYSVESSIYLKPESLHRLF